MSDSYIFRYATIMVVLVAAVLSAFAMLLKPAQEKNVAVARMRAILASAHVEASASDAIPLFKKYIVEEDVISPDGDIIGIYRDGKLEKGDVRAFNIDLKTEFYNKSQGKKYELPLYIARVNDRKYYIFPLLGRGLWGQIYGNLALEDDLNTVAGAMFGDDKETPGLGAEIAEKPFQEQFIGKKIFDGSGKFTSIKVIKGASKVLPPDELVHGVDAVSGGTITSNGVSAMLQSNLENYLNFIKKQKSK